MRTIIIPVGSPHSAVMRESADTVSAKSCVIGKHRTITRAPLLLFFFSCPDTDSVIFPEDSILSQLGAGKWALCKADELDCIPGLRKWRESSLTGSWLLSVPKKGPEWPVFILRGFSGQRR